MTPEEIAAAAAAEAARVAAEAAAAEAAQAEAEAEAARLAAIEAAKQGKPTDEEAKLLKELMKTKTANAAAKAALDAANAKIAEYEGMDPAKMKALMAAADAAELEAAEKRGEYDRIIKAVRDETKVKLSAKDEAIATKEAELAAAKAQIDQLTVGSSFSGSKFIATETMLSPDKARRLYGDHFEVKNGEFVAYDKPKGAAERTPLVDGNGNPLAFEAAIEKILRADPDFEAMAKSKMKVGSGSDNKDIKLPGNTPPAQISGLAIISRNLSKLTATAS